MGIGRVITGLTENRSKNLTKIYKENQDRTNIKRCLMISPEKRVVDPSWNFKEANTKEYTHGIHTYPAMMIPQIARRLIEEYGQNPQIIVDPFMGSGSSMVEAIIKDSAKKVYGLEINPLAILIAKVKTRPLNPASIQKEFNNIKTGFDSLPKQASPKFTNIDFWFKPEVIEQLSKLKVCIEQVKNEDIKDFLKVCFSETTRNVSNTRKGEFKLYRIPEEKLKVHNPDVLKMFEKVFVKNLGHMNELYSKLKDNSYAQVKIIKQDTRKKNSIGDGECDFLVSSPPYGDSKTTVAYGQFSRLGSQWLGYDEKEVKDVDKEGLGGIPTKDLMNPLKSETLSNIVDKISEIDKKRARDVLSFYMDFDKCTDEINRIMKKGSRLCFVIGNRTVKKVNIPTDKIIAELFVNKFGYKHHKTIVREIPSKRMPKANSPSNKKGDLVSTMNHEYIVILEK